MQELVPRLIDDMPGQGSSSSGGGSSSGGESAPRPTSEETTVRRMEETEAENSLGTPRAPAQKRTASKEAGEAPAETRLRTTEQEDLFCQVTLDNSRLYSGHVESLMAAFLQKRAQKELPAQGNSPELQSEIDEAKVIEWDTIQSKTAVKVWTGPKAQEIREKYGHRFIGSRFVVTRKTDEEGTRVKARWCLQGHNDPDFHEKILSGECHSPTLHQLSRALLLQILVSKKWVLNLGDIKGAFLEAGPIPAKYRPLYASHPAGGIPGVSSEDVIEIVGNLYGANDAPSQWYKEFDQQAREAGFQRSAFDPCLYYFRNSQNELSGVLGAHVDDTATGGEGPEYLQAIAKLKTRFKYRKWRQGSGEFCGVQYSQDPQSLEISYDQSTYAKHIRPIQMSRDRQKQREDPATDREVSALRAVNGALGWLSSQSRPDLCVQASFSQQCFPQPKVKDLAFANQIVHRSRQHSEVSVTVKHVEWDDLCIMFHSDAAFANAANNKTQAGYVLAFTNSSLARGDSSPWSPFCWKSYRMARVVASTLAGETQSFATASGIAEWMSLMVAEAKKGCFDLRESEDHLQSVPLLGITDCKSLYDALNTPTSPSKVDDKRVAIDLSIIRQSMSRTKLQVRWCPTELMVADSLTKDQADPADLMRAMLAHGTYQLSREAEVLALKKDQRERRVSRRSSSSTTPTGYPKTCVSSKEQPEVKGSEMAPTVEDHGSVNLPLVPEASALQR